MQGTFLHGNMASITAEISLECTDPKKIFESLEPEIQGTERFKVEIKPEQSALRLRVEATDVAAMKAALNSYLRLISIISEVDK